MRVAVITIAGVSSRFNKDIPEENKELKAIYFEGNHKSTLLYHLLTKCAYADRIVLVGGYKYETLTDYVGRLEDGIKDRIILSFNEHYDDLGSGYSLFLGLREAFKINADEVLFVEGDLDIDTESFERVISTSGNVLTYTSDPIYADKAVVLYRDDHERYRYAFNRSHGLLTIDKPFSCILNSGQTWKFSDMESLCRANDRFCDEAIGETNLWIIQDYLDAGVEVELVPLARWINCNTREDYKMIVEYWENER